MNQGSAGNGIAALASFFVAGLGQLVQGRLGAAAGFFIACYIFYTLGALTGGLLLIIALPLHLWCIIDAAKFDPNKK